MRTKRAGLYQCQFLGFDLALQLSKMSSSGEAGYKMYGTLSSIFQLPMILYYFKIKSVKNVFGICQLNENKKNLIFFVGDYFVAFIQAQKA